MHYFLFFLLTAAIIALLGIFSVYDLVHCPSTDKFHLLIISKLVLEALSDETIIIIIVKRFNFF